MTADFDIVVIGAGAAGIAAARALSAAGRQVVLVEASDRVGGRAWTRAVDGMTLDMGCGWLHSADRNPMVKRAEASGFAIDRSTAAWRAQHRDLGFPKAEQREAWSEWDAFHRRLVEAPPPSDRAGDAWPAGSRWRGYAEALSGYMNGANLDTLSIADFLAYDDRATDNNWRVHAGYGAVIAAQLPPVRLTLATPVERIALTPSGVTVSSPRGAIAARAAILTVSTNVLARGAIALPPDASDHLVAASHLPLGLADKLFLAVDGTGSFEPETHVIGDPHRAETGSYYIRPFGWPVIEGFFGGCGAELLEAEGLAAAFSFAIDQLVELFGSAARSHLRPIVGSLWCCSDHVLGSYSHALPGHADARAVLARPIEDRLFFAGEATHPFDFSTAHGAWESGERAAAEALSVLDRS